MEDIDSPGVAPSCAPSSSSKVQWVDRSSAHSSEARGATGLQRNRGSQAEPVNTGDPPTPLSDSRSKSLQRYLSAQTDVDEEVLSLYKMVCRV